MHLVKLKRSKTTFVFINNIEYLRPMYCEALLQIKPVLYKGGNKNGISMKLSQWNLKFQLHTIKAVTLNI